MNHINNETWSSINDLGSGIYVFKNVIPKNSIDMLESVMSDDKNEYSYNPAMVGYGEIIKDYRDCFDFKYKKTQIEHDSSYSGLVLQKLWDAVYENSLPAVKKYCEVFNISELRYWEAMNFVKYGPGQHFQEHTDHGFSYNCTVSLVGYPNDDYEGGEIYFRLQDLKIKPDAGDLFIFPSNYMYPHRAMPVTSGTKYSIVTMLDYSAKYHTEDIFKETNT
jgi:hypothetical protein